MTQLKTDPEFKDLIPPLTKAEYHQLEQNILTQNQCHNAIQIWKGIIIDGHNRYAICQEHNIPYRTAPVSFKSRNDAKLWIITNQLGRRNLTDAARISLALSQATLLQEKARQNRRIPGAKPVHVRKTIAAWAGVSEHTVHKYLTIREVGSTELIGKVDSGQLKIGTAHKMLEVTTRLVEEYQGDDIPRDMSSQPYKDGACKNIDRINKLYDFIDKNAGLIFASGDSEMTRVIKRLDKQLKMVRDVASVFAG